MPQLQENKMKRDLMSLHDLTTEEIFQILEVSAKMKQVKSFGEGMLAGKSLALLFQKPSNRTRVSFEVGITQLGGHCMYLGPSEINLGVREATSDVSKTLSRYLDGIVARTNTHHDIIELSENADIPVINGLSDLYHPCQGLTDLFSIKEKFGKLEGLKLAYVGDGNNVCHSLMIGAAKTGMNMSIAAPKGYEPNKDILKETTELAKGASAEIAVTNSPQEAVKDADVIYTDVWVSMGQEEESQERLNEFFDYQINGELAKLAKDSYIFMHCLPAHRGEEVTEEVIDGENSIIFDQAENRLHTQKAILSFLYKA